MVFATAVLHVLGCVFGGALGGWIGGILGKRRAAAASQRGEVVAGDAP